MDAVPPGLPQAGGLGAAALKGFFRATFSCLKNPAASGGVLQAFGAVFSRRIILFTNTGINGIVVSNLK